MSSIEVTEVQTRIKNLENQRLQAIANVNAIDGAIAILKDLESSTKPAPQAAAADNVVPFATPEQAS